VHSNARSSETGHRLSATPIFFARGEQDLPGYWVTLFERAVVIDPARRRLASPDVGEDGAAFRLAETLGHRIYFFGAVLSTSHPIACLRIADVVTAIVARLAPDLPGLALVARAGSRGVTYRISRFTPSFRTSRAWSHQQNAAPP